MSQDKTPTPLDAVVEQLRLFMIDLNGAVDFHFYDTAMPKVRARAEAIITAMQSETTLSNGAVRGPGVADKGSVQYGDAPDQSSKRCDDKPERQVLIDVIGRMLRLHEGHTFDVLAKRIADEVLSLRSAVARSIPCPRCGVNEGEKCRDFNEAAQRCNSTPQSASAALKAPLVTNELIKGLCDAALAIRRGDGGAQVDADLMAQAAEALKSVVEPIQCEDCWRMVVPSDMHATDRSER